jgi:L-lactate dehydrogenase complex protein LldG
VSARDRILDRVRAGARGGSVHPGRFAPAPRSASFERFAAALARAGGEAVGPVAQSELRDAVLRVVTRFGGGRAVAEPAALALLGGGPFESAERCAAPAGFADVAVGVATGCLGVAENGAVALRADTAPHRALHFLCERLILLLDVGALVPDLHAACERLAPDVASLPHLVLVAGPSKTADIEQALVVGAHGPRALAVVVYQSDGAGVS